MGGEKRGGHSSPHKQSGPRRSIIGEQSGRPSIPYYISSSAAGPEASGHLTAALTQAAREYLALEADPAPELALADLLRDEAGKRREARERNPDAPPPDALETLAAKLDAMRRDIAALADIVIKEGMAGYPAHEAARAVFALPALLKDISRVTLSGEGRASARIMITQIQARMDEAGLSAALAQTGRER